MQPCGHCGYHSSRAGITARLKRPTRITQITNNLSLRNVIPIWSCSRWGLPCHACYQPRGALLPHHFTLTIMAFTEVCAPSWRYNFCGTFPKWVSRTTRRTLSGTVVCSEPGLSSRHTLASTTSDNLTSPYV